MARMQDRTSKENRKSVFGGRSDGVGAGVCGSGQFDAIPGVSCLRGTAPTMALAGCGSIPHKGAAFSPIE
jgi:hypothetical protein